MDSTREKRMLVVGEAQRIHGLSRDEKIAAMYPADDAAVARQMFKKQQKCALFARAVLYGCGYEDEDKSLPYANRFKRGEKAPKDAVHWVRALPGFHLYGGSEKWPGFWEGNVYLIKGTSDSSLHVLIPIGLLYTQSELLSLDGTGDDSGVRKVMRKLVNVSGVPGLYDDVMGVRKVFGWVDVSKVL